jgi:hypothetical protein
MHEILVLRLVILDAAPSTDVPPACHPHNYIFRGIEALDRTLRAITTEHDRVFVHDGFKREVAHCYAGMPPWIDPSIKWPIVFS